MWTCLKVFLAEHKETKEVFTIEQRETSPPYMPRIVSPKATHQLVIVLIVNVYIYSVRPGLLAILT